MRVLMILPALTEATSPFFRPIKYSLFPPLGLATLAAYLEPGTDARLVDEHVEAAVDPDDPAWGSPDLVVIQTYITNARRAYRLADGFRSRGSFVILGGLHATSLPEEARAHADALCLGPGEETFPRFLAAWRAGEPCRGRTWDSRHYPRSLQGIPPVRRDLIRRSRYLVPNSIVVTRGCPHHCTFCYKDAFFQGGRSFYVQRVDDALAEIERLPGRHLYFLDDHLFGHVRSAQALFDGLRGMHRVFQGAATVESVLRTDLADRAAKAGLRSLFLGFESLSETSLAATRKTHNLDRQGKRRDYEEAIRRLGDLGISVNGSFVFGLDGDGPDVFSRTVDWAVRMGLTTSTFHIATPYPGTEFFRQTQSQGRLLHRDWDLYDTRHAVLRPRNMTPGALEEGYRRAYRDFYSWKNITRGALAHTSASAKLKHWSYAALWKRCEPAWNVLIRSGALGAARPVIEAGLDLTRRAPRRDAHRQPQPGAPAGFTQLTVAATSPTASPILQRVLDRAAPPEDDAAASAEDAA
ncbi:MAG: radical SAM protein [Phycisphaerales bacterium]